MMGSRVRVTQAAPLLTPIRRSMKRTLGRAWVRNPDSQWNPPVSAPFLLHGLSWFHVLHALRRPGSRDARKRRRLEIPLLLLPYRRIERAHEGPCPALARGKVRWQGCRGRGGNTGLI